jgi:hypothetical protein
MKIIKKMRKKNDITLFISNIIDLLVKNLDQLLRFNEIGFIFGDDEYFKLNEKDVEIGINVDDQLILLKDVEITKYKLLHQIFHAIIRSYGIRTNHWLEDILVNREILKSGFTKEYFYFSYVKIVHYESPGKTDMQGFLRVNIPWLSFYSIDKYNSLFFLHVIDKFNFDPSLKEKTKSLFDVTKKNLWLNKNLIEAEKIYNELMKE